MTVYIIDAYQINQKNNSPQSEIVWLHRDLFRGCTISRYVMQVYYNFITKLLGEYVIFETYEYQVDSSYDYTADNMPEDILSPLALSLYNNDKPRGKVIHSMPILLSFRIESVNASETDIFVIPQSLNELFLDETMYYTEPEYNILEDTALLFTALPNYILPLKDNKTFESFCKLILYSLPDMMFDFYNTEGRLHISPTHLIMNWVVSLGFMDIVREKEVQVNGGC